MHLSLVFGSAVAHSGYKTITPSIRNNQLCVAHRGACFPNDDYGLDCDGGDAQNGDVLWLMECSGTESQIWVVDHDQIRYGANEDFCIDAGAIRADDIKQLVLWECNGRKQQTWGYEKRTSEREEAFRVLEIAGGEEAYCYSAWSSEAGEYLPVNGSTCMDFYDDRPNPEMERQTLRASCCAKTDFNKWQMSSQKWNLWDSPSPAAAPAPAPLPVYPELVHLLV